MARSFAVVAACVSLLEFAEPRSLLANLVMKTRRH
jgi:hypothetical protein